MGWLEFDTQGTLPLANYTHYPHLGAGGMWSGYSRKNRVREIRLPREPSCSTTNPTQFDRVALRNANTTIFRGFVSYRVV